MDLQQQLSLFTEPHEVFSIRKHSSLVQMGGLWILDRKAINALILVTKDQIKRNPEQKVFQTELRIVKRLARYLSNNNKKLKMSLLKLQNESFEYNLFSKDKSRRWGSFSFLSHVDIQSKRGEKAILTYEFPSIILDSIQDPRMYVMLNIFLASDLSTHRYSGAFYELLKDYKGIGKIKLSLVRIRKFLGLEGKYEAFSMLKKRVLDPVVEELNLKTELKLRYNPIMEKGKFTDIIFTIHTKDWEILLNETTEYIKRRLKDFELTDKQIETAIRIHDHDYLIGNIKVIEDDIKRRWNKIKSVPASMMNALKKDYRPKEDNLFTDLVEHKKSLINKQAEQRIIEREQEKEELNLKNELKVLLKERTKLLSKAEYESLQKEFIDGFQKKEAKSMAKIAFEKYGFDHKVVQSARNCFLQERLLIEKEKIQFQKIELVSTR